MSFLVSHLSKVFSDHSAQSNLSSFTYRVLYIQYCGQTKPFP